MIKVKNLIFAFFLAISCFQLNANRLVYLIANPRSKLVEFLRMIGQRGDFKVMHISANWAYCHAHNQTDIVKGWYREDAPKTYAKAKEDILEELKKSDVFVGENTHAAKDFLQENEEFVQNKEIQFIFLVSNPHSAITSYYNKKKDFFDKLPASQMTESMVSKIYIIF